MGLNSTKLNILINELNEEKLVEQLGLTLNKVLCAARETNSLSVIAKNIFIENDKIKLNKCLYLMKNGENCVQ